MTSNIDPTHPVTGNALTANVRANFQAAYDEITALQAGTVSLIGVAKGLDMSVATQYPIPINVPAGQAYIISDVYLVNSTNGPITDGGATLYSQPGDVGQIISFAFYMFGSNPNSFIWVGAGNIQPWVSYSISTLYLSTDAGSGNTPSTPPAFVDLYVFGFPL